MTSTSVDVGLIERLQREAAVFALEAKRADSPFRAEIEDTTRELLTEAAERLRTLLDKLASVEAEREELRGQLGLEPGEGPDVIEAGTEVIMPGTGVSGLVLEIKDDSCRVTYPNLVMRRIETYWFKAKDLRRARSAMTRSS